MLGKAKQLPKKIVATIVRRPWLVLLAGLLAVAAVSSGLPRIRTNFTHTAFFEPDDPDLVRFNKFERRFGNDDAVIVVVHSPSGIFDQDSAQLLRELTDRMWKVPEVIRVDSLSNFQWVHATGDDIEVENLLPNKPLLSDDLLAERKQIALKHEVLPGYLVSEDATSALVYARIKPGIDGPPDPKRINEGTQAVIDDLQRGDHTMYLLGGPVINDSFRKSSASDMSVLVPALLLMIAFLLVLRFRSLGGVVIPFAVIIATVLPAMAMSGWLGLELSSVTFILPQVLIAVCVADAVHLLSSFYRARRRGMSRRDAAEYSLTKNFVPTLLTSVTTAAGFLSFLSANLPPLEGFGVLAGIGTLLAWLTSYAVVGPLMVLWPGKEEAGVVSADEEQLALASPRAKNFMGLVELHKWRLIGVFAVITGAAIYFGASNEVNSNPYEYFAKSVPVRKAQDFALKNLSGIATFELVVDSGKEEGAKEPAFLRKVEAFEQRLLEIDGINRVVSLVDILRQTNRALMGGAQAEYKLPDTVQGVAQELLMYTMGLPQGMDVNDRIDVKNSSLRVTVISTLVQSNRVVDTATRIRAIGAELGLNVVTTGKNLLYQGMNGRVVESFLRSLTLAVFFIGLFILLAFRSVKMALLSAIPNTVPLLVGAAVLHFLRGTIDIGTVMVSSVCLGIAVDNTIHIVTSYQQHTQEGHSGRDSFERLLTHTGPAMITTAVVLVVGFSTLAFGSFIPNVYFGILSAVILGFGLIADIVLLPAVLLALESRKTQRAST